MGPLWAHYGPTMEDNDFAAEGCNKKEKGHDGPTMGAFLADLSLFRVPFGLHSGLVRGPRSGLHSGTPPGVPWCLA